MQENSYILYRDKLLGEHSRDNNKIYKRGGGTAKAELSDAKVIGKNIRKYRKKNGLTQEALAFEADISVKMLSEYENGKHNISQEALSKIADVLYVSVDELLPERSRRVQGDTSEEEKLLALFRNMSAADKNMIMGMAERLGAAS